MTHSDPSLRPERPEEMPARYEKTQMRGRPFVIGTIFFFALMTSVLALAWALIGNWSYQPWPQKSAPVPALVETRWNRDVPQVQINPAIDLARVRNIEHARLHTQRWTDAAHTYAIIPIEDAMKITADAAAHGQLNTVLPAPQPATPLQLQDQKSRETAPAQVPNS